MRKSSCLFLLLFSLAVNVFAANEDNNGWSKDAEKCSLYMIGHAHIDPVWLWPWSEGMAVVHSTFRSALDRMNENPDYVFSCSSAQFYEWVAVNDPEMMKEIKKREKEGRWELVGGWWVEPDVHMASGEALVRHGLYGQASFKKLFGKTVSVGLNADTFGHTASLPQILQKQGITNYTFLRPTPYEMDFPSEVFEWQGIDGTKILSCRIQDSYNIGHDLQRRIDKLASEHLLHPTDSLMIFYGVGDHGGGPTKEMLKWIDETRTQSGAPKMHYSSIGDYFSDIKESGVEVPIVDEDLQIQAIGCYTAETNIKKKNRQSESALGTAEKIAAVGSNTWGAEYPMQDITTAWLRILLMQFHDSLAGTALESHSDVADAAYGHALDIAKTVKNRAIQKLEWQIAAEDPNSQYWIVFNPNPWEVEDYVENDCPAWWQENSIVLDANGNSLWHQWTRPQTINGMARLVTKVKVPAMGYTQIRLTKMGNVNVVNNKPESVRADLNGIENNLYKLTFNSNGSIQIYDKKNDKNVFLDDSGFKAIVLKDTGDTWGHDITAFTEGVIGSFDNASFKVIENGPLRVTVRMTTSYNLSSMSADFSLYANNPKIDVKVTLDWHEHLKLMKLSFPLNAESVEATYEIPFGNIKRKTNGVEEPGHRWISLNSPDGYGITVFNDSKYGYSVDGSNAMVSIVRSTPFAHHFPNQVDTTVSYKWMDQGIQSFEMSILPHKGTWKENNVIRLTEQFSSRLESIAQGIHRGKLPKSASFLSVDNPNVVISAVKLAENGKDYIIRCVELGGQKRNINLDIAFCNTSWKGEINPYEIKTLLVSPKGKIKGVNLLEE